MAKLLLVDNNGLIIKAFTGILLDWHYRLETADNLDEALKIISRRQFQFDGILWICHYAPAKVTEGIELLAALNRLQSGAKVIILATPQAVKTAIGAKTDVKNELAQPLRHLGFADYIPQPTDTDKLRTGLETALTAE